MQQHEAQSCPEYAELSRRGFLQATSGTLAGLAAASAWLPRVAVAKDYGKNDRVVSAVRPNRAGART